MAQRKGLERRPGWRGGAYEIDFKGGLKPGVRDKKMGEPSGKEEQGMTEG